MNQVRTALILFGAPGSGKGTQAQRLTTCLHAPHIATGDILRQHIQLGDQLGREVESVLKAGLLVTDDLVNKLVEERLDREDAQGAIILDGYPRTAPQAGAMLRMFEARKIAPVVVHLKVDYNRIIKRLSGRRVCPVCGTLYSTVSSGGSHPPKIEGICDLDGARLITRPDDNPAVIRRRLEEYDMQTKPLVEYFQSRGVPYHELDGGDGAPEVISERICALVRPELGKPELGKPGLVEPVAAKSGVKPVSAAAR
ncbi:MAG TPA: nucleoside monophosphate kinase [Bryobacteraceae bacterium]|nr:nucleoside monophosphate kinase [Bryobacteraceae bacterium]